MKTIKILISLAIICQSVSVSAKQYYGSVFGIRSDGETINTGSLQKAIDYISTESPGDTLTIWVGRYLTGSVQLKSNVTIMLNEGAIIVGVTSAYDYENVNGNSAIFLAEGQENIKITGKGVIEGNSRNVAEQYKAQEEKGYIKSAETAKPSLIAMDKCKNVSVNGIMLQDFCKNAQVYTNCSNVSLDSLIITGTNANNKGLIFKNNSDVKISDCYIQTSGTPIESSDNKNISASRTITPDGSEVKL